MSLRHKDVAVLRMWWSNQGAVLGVFDGWREKEGKKIITVRKKKIGSKLEGFGEIWSCL